MTSPINASYLYELREFAFSSCHAFRNALSRMSMEAQCIAEKGSRNELPATWDQRPDIQGPASYLSEIEPAKALLDTQPTWNGVGAEAVARMRLQNRFKTGLDVARYTAALMRADMAAYDGDPTKYTQSLGCWHGFIAQQKLISVKKHFGKTDRRYLYLSGWMIAALRSEFGPLPDQSMHEKTSVPALIEELYTFLRQADSRELNDIFRALDAARKAGDKAKE